MLIDIALNDVRCVPTGARCGTANASGPADYSGEMRFSFTFRLTDHWNATAPGGGTDPATVQDFTIVSYSFLGVCAERIHFHGLDLQPEHQLNAHIPGAAQWT